MLEWDKKKLKVYLLIMVRNIVQGNEVLTVFPIFIQHLRN